MLGIIVKAVFVDVIEEGGEAVVIALRNGIEFVVMTPGAFKGQSQAGGTESIDPVGDVFGAPFLLDAAAFVGLAMQPVEGRGQTLTAGGMRQKVAGQLFDQKFVVGKVAV